MKSGQGLRSSRPGLFFGPRSSGLGSRAVRLGPRTAYQGARPGSSGGSAGARATYQGARRVSSWAVSSWRVFACTCKHGERLPGRDTRATDQGEGPRVERPSLSGLGEGRAAWASSGGRPKSRYLGEKKPAERAGLREEKRSRDYGKRAPRACNAIRARAAPATAPPTILASGFMPPRARAVGRPRPRTLPARPGEGLSERRQSRRLPHRK